MFEERLTPFQKNLLKHLDDTARKPRQVREMLRDIAGRIVDAPAKGQIGLMGLSPLTKEGIVYAVINKQREDIGEPTFQVPPTPATGKELEKPEPRGIESTGRLGQAVGLGAGEDTGLAARTSVQVGLAGLGKEAAQIKAFEEFGGAPGAAGKKETLIDVEAERAREVAKPLPGQIRLEDTKPIPKRRAITIPPVDITKGVVIRGRRLVANKENIQAAKGFVKELRRRAKAADKEAKAVTPAKARTLQANARAARRDADRIESTIPKIKAGKRYSLSALRAIQAGRSLRSQITDNRQLHSQVIDTTSPRVAPWITKPGIADISGVDTPITKRPPRLSGGRARITPKTPRLRR